MAFHRISLINKIWLYYKGFIRAIQEENNDNLQRHFLSGDFDLYLIFYADYFTDWSESSNLIGKSGNVCE